MRRERYGLVAEAIHTFSIVIVLLLVRLALPVIGRSLLLIFVIIVSTLLQVIFARVAICDDMITI